LRSAEAVGLLSELAGDEPVISSLGTPSFHLYAVGDRNRNFYLWASMGMASSVGLGVAIAKPDRRVFVVDGDGAALMNLGGMVTVGRRRPKNLVWMILENGVFLETGAQPIASVENADLVGLGRAAGIESAVRCEDKAALRAALEHARRRPGPHLVVARVDPDSTDDRPKRDPFRIKLRFMDAIA
jgi:thiamine pyrophosphate-dependent acetolactate synthase large subunit-like protein